MRKSEEFYRIAYPEGEEKNIEKTVGIIPLTEEYGNLIIMSTYNFNKTASEQYFKVFIKIFDPKVKDRFSIISIKDQSYINEFNETVGSGKLTESELGLMKALLSRPVNDNDGFIDKDVYEDGMNGWQYLLTATNACIAEGPAGTHGKVTITKTVPSFESLV